MEWKKLNVITNWIELSMWWIINSNWIIELNLGNWIIYNRFELIGMTIELKLNIIYWMLLCCIKLCCNGMFWLLIIIIWLVDVQSCWIINRIILVCLILLELTHCRIQLIFMQKLVGMHTQEVRINLFVVWFNNW